jgi:flagellin-like hook-associated protein FlgL
MVANMFGRIQNDGLPASVTSVQSVTARADLGVAPVATGAELPETAVNAAANSQQLSPDGNARAAVAGVLGHIRTAVGKSQDMEKAGKQLDEIRSRLLLGHSDLSTDTPNPEAVKKAQKALADLQQIVMLHPLKDMTVVTNAKTAETKPVFKHVELPPLHKGEQQDPRKTSVGPADRDQVLDKIQNALDRIDTLQVKLGENQAENDNRLFNLSTSVSGLNTARYQVDDSPFSLTAASTAVENIMTNVKAAVIAHGKASSDIVQIVLTA